MNSRLVGILAIVSIVGIAPAHAATYTLDYTGDAYTNTHCTPDCGSNMTASITFNVDPATLSGQVYLNNLTDVSSVSISSGQYSASTAAGTLSSSDYVTFSGGVITY